MVFQSFNLFANMTVLQNCILAQTKVLGRSKEAARQRALALLDKVGMAPYINARPTQISGGQRQRVAIARALAAEGTTMLVVTHELQFARRIATNILFMQDGMILEQTPPQQFFAAPQHAATREFLGRLQG